MGTTYGPGVHGSGGISNPSQLPPSAPGYNPNWVADITGNGADPTGGGAIPGGVLPPGSNAAGTGIPVASTNAEYNQSIINSLAISPAPLAPEAIVPEYSLEGLQSVFGPDWQSAPAFTPEIQGKGILGAVRVGDNPNVFLLGPGGSTTTPVSAQAFYDTFGTSEQGGIVGNITQEEANRLGISQGAIDTPVGPGISSETIADSGSIDLDTGADSTQSDADIILAGIKKDLELQEALKTQEEKDKEEEADALQEEIKNLLGEDAVDPAELQLAEEEKRNIEEQQQALDDANNALQIKIAEIDALTASYNLENQIVEGKPISLGRQQGQQAQNYKMYLAQKNSLTAEAGLLHAVALGLQNKLQSAQAAADRATNLRWSSYETELNNRIKLYNIIEGQLTKLEKPRAEALKRYWDQEKERIADAKSKEKANYSTLLSQMNQYPDAGIALTDSLEVANQKITQNSRIYQQATRLAGGGGGGDGDDGELSDMEYDFQEGARMVILAEQSGTPEQSGEQYGKLLELLMTEYPYLTRENANAMLMKSIQGLKGETPQTIQETEQNIGSDFETEEPKARVEPTQSQYITPQQAQQQGGYDVQLSREQEEKRAKAKQKAIDNGFVYWTDPITGERKPTNINSSINLRSDI